MLQTSLDRRINRLTPEFLASIITLPGFKTTIGTDYFKILISCVRVIDNRAAVIQGCEQLAATAAMCLLRTIPYLLRVDPKSRILKDMVQQYNVTGSFHPRLISGTSLSATRSTGPTTFPPARPPEGSRLERFRPFYSGKSFALARFGQYRLVLLHKVQVRRSEEGAQLGTSFFTSLSVTGSQAPASVISDCLMIITIDLGRDISEGDVMNPVKRYTFLAQLRSSSP